jgi:antitoxin YefM
MDQVGYTELRQNLARYLDQVVDDRAPLLVTRQGGRGNVVILSADDYAGWEETVYLLSSPANAERLIASIEDIRAGKTTERELIEPTLAGTE